MSSNHPNPNKPKIRRTKAPQPPLPPSSKAKKKESYPLPRLEWGLQQIKDRYYHEGVIRVNNKKFGINGGQAEVHHFADCAIFRSLDHYGFAFCSCGLLHDLERILADSGLIEVIYPRYWHDYNLQERGEDSDNETPEIRESKRKEKEECERILLEVFGPPGYTTLTEIKQQHEGDKKLLRKVFGKRFPNAFFRLDQRLAERIEDHRRHERYKAACLSSSS